MASQKFVMCHLPIVCPEQTMAFIPTLSRSDTS